MQSTRISLSLLALQLLNSVHFYSVHLIDSHCHYNKVRIITSPPSIHPRNIFLSGTDPIYTTSTCLSMLFVYNPTAIILLDPRTEINKMKITSTQLLLAGGGTAENQEGPTLIHPLAPITASIISSHNYLKRTLRYTLQASHRLQVSSRNSFGAVTPQ